MCSGDSMVRQELSNEAVRLGRILTRLMPDEPEAGGLLALMLFIDSRREARTSPEGETVLLEDQDRSRWNREQIDEAEETLSQALRRGLIGVYQVQAAIAAEHARAANPSETNWSRIVALYDSLLELHPSPVVALNRAVAVAMKEGPGRGLEIVEGIERSGELGSYRFLHATRAELLHGPIARAEGPGLDPHSS